MDTQEFGVYVVPIEKQDFENEKFDLFRVSGNNVVTLKGYFENGETVGYIPENAILSHKAHRLIQAYSLITDIPEETNKKPYQIRKPYRCSGTQCMGFIIKTNRGLGENLCEELEIEKIPTVHPDAHVRNGITDPEKWNHKYTVHYNIKHLDSEDTFPFGEEDVIVTEKIHGTWCQFCFVIPEKKVYITSKGYAKKGAYFHDNTKNEYCTMFDQLNIRDTGFEIFSEFEKVFVLGEVFGTFNGRKIQDLTYSYDTLQFRVFDIRIDGKYIPYDQMLVYAKKLNLVPVPLLYYGPYKESIKELARGKESVSGNESHIREGVVIKSSIENEKKRHIYKIISPEYYDRKHGTEYN